jgi:hypothetical protein
LSENDHSIAVQNQRPPGLGRGAADLATYWLHFVLDLANLQPGGCL